MKRFKKIMKSPVGRLTLVADEESLLAVEWEGSTREWGAEPSLKHRILSQAEMQLEEYFRGERQKFELPIRFEGTEFQQKVWNELRKIPYGKSISYSELARRIARPRACRAAGAANGKNPLSIVVPCHRVIGKNGDLTGFAGGMENKKFLLELERGVG